jgi:general secretion pathway protein H
VRSARHTRGFTLIELLLVIVFIGVSTALVVSSVSTGLGKANERQVVAAMVDVLRSAKTKAIVTGQPVRAVFDLANRRYQAPGEAVQHWPNSLEVSVTSSSELGSAFEFYPSGGASGGHIDVKVGDQQWRIDVAWLSGNVKARKRQ